MEKDPLINGIGESNLDIEEENNRDENVTAICGKNELATDNGMDMDIDEKINISTKTARVST